jgi:hypothetical protein
MHHLGMEEMEMVELVELVGVMGKVVGTKEVEMLARALEERMEVVKESSSKFSIQTDEDLERHLITQTPHTPCSTQAMMVDIEKLQL